MSEENKPASRYRVVLSEYNGVPRAEMCVDLQGHYVSFEVYNRLYQQHQESQARVARVREAIEDISGESMMLNQDSVIWEKVAAELLAVLDGKEEP